MLSRLREMLCRKKETPKAISREIPKSGLDALGYLSMMPKELRLNLYDILLHEIDLIPLRAKHPSRGQLFGLMMSCYIDSLNKHYIFVHPCLGPINLKRTLFMMEPIYNSSTNDAELDRALSLARNDLLEYGDKELKNEICTSDYTIWYAPTKAHMWLIWSLRGSIRSGIKKKMLLKNIKRVLSDDERMKNSPFLHMPGVSEGVGYYLMKDSIDPSVRLVFPGRNVLPLGYPDSGPTFSLIYWAK